MYKALAYSLALLTADAASAEPMWMEFGTRIVHLSIKGTLKEPLPDHPDTVDFSDHGTGFIVSPDGLVLTAAHLIPNPELFDGDGFKIEGRLPVVDMDSMTAAPPVHTLTVVSGNNPRPPFDAGLLRINDSSGPWPYLRLCNSYDKNRGVRFPILGYQGGMYLLTSNEGSISAGEGASTNILIDTSINGGNSGGPIFNEKGQVFGIAVAIRTIDGQRMSNATQVVSMKKVISVLGDKANSLFGVSYDPDCNKPLLSKINSSQLINVPIQTLSRVKWDTNGIFATPVPTMEAYNVIDYALKAPDGFKWVGGSSARMGQNELQSNIQNGGEFLAIGNKQEVGGNSGQIIVKVDGQLEPIQPKILRESVTDIRTFPYSQTQEKHDIGVTQKSYVDKIKAPDGFLFKEIVNIDYQSINHSPTKGAVVKIINNGEELELSYSLESGPFYDQWRGWIDALITAKIISKPKN